MTNYKAAFVLGVLSALFAERSFSAPALPTVPISFSGTSGSTNTPSLLTLSQPIQFLLNANAASGDFMLFTIKYAQPAPQPTQSFILGPSFSSSILYSVNGSGSYQVSGWADGGYASGDVAATDSYFWMVLGQNIFAGDLITFSAGSLGGTPGDAAFDVPASGNYTTFLANASTGFNGQKISDYGSVVPEPSALSLLAVGLGGLAMLRRRRPR